MSTSHPMRAPGRLMIVAPVIVSLGLGSGDVAIGAVAGMKQIAMSPPASVVARADRASCPVTVPNGSSPPNERSSPYHHGNGVLWTVLSPDGAIRIPPEDVLPDGSLDMKSPWWRSVAQQLTIVGHRLDAAAPPLRATTPQGRRLDVPIRTAFGPWPDGPGTPRAGGTPEPAAIRFQATNLNFPSEGCWEIMAAAGDASLIIVTFVVRDDVRDN